jgi:hypothetical protein
MDGGIGRIAGRLRLLASLALVLLTTLLVGAIRIYAGNAGEFDVGLVPLLHQLALPALALFAVVVTPGLLGSRRWAQVYASILATGVILLWVQGALLLRDYGLMGQGPLKWEGNEAWGLFEALFWSVALLLGIAGSRQIAPHLASLVTILAIVQVGQLASLLLTHSELRREEGIAAPAAVFGFSSDRNVVHILMDEFQTTLFKELLREDPARASGFDGFTVFEEATSSFPTTYVSVPAALSAKVYRNEKPLTEFMSSVYESPTILSAAYDAGYEVDIVKSVGFSHLGPYTNHFHLPIAYGMPESEHTKANAQLLLQLTLFRHLPHHLKKIVWANEGALFRALVGFGHFSHSAARLIAHRAFVSDLIAQAAITRDAPVYKFIHLLTIHWPPVLDAECNFSPRGYDWENMRNQARCGLEQLLALLLKLESIGVYDSALILVHADHGYWHIADPGGGPLVRPSPDRLLADGSFIPMEHFEDIVGSSLPLLAIKPPGSRGALRFSRAQVELRDIPATVSSLLGYSESFLGESAFEVREDVVRPRAHLFYDEHNRPGEEYFPRLEEFEISGSALDQRSWRLLALRPDPGMAVDDRLDLGSGRATKARGPGWDSDPEMDSQRGYARALGHKAFLLLNVPRDRPSTLTLSVSGPGAGVAQVMTLRLDGSLLGSRQLAPAASPSFEEYSFEIDPDPRRGNVGVLELEFARVRPDRDGVPVAALVRWVRVSEG